MSATGKRAAVDEPGAYATGQPEGKHQNVGGSRTKTAEDEAAAARRHPNYSDFLRECKQEMGEEVFAQWICFGNETITADIKKFEDWVDKYKPERDGELHNLEDVHVILQSAVVPVSGQDNMRALLTVPGAEVGCDGGGMDLSGSADLLVVFDQSGSMRENVDMLKKAAIKMADDEANLKNQGVSTVKLSFAYAQFGTHTKIPMHSDNKRGPAGYSPWMPLDNMKAEMRNVAQTLNSEMGGTSMKQALEDAVAMCLHRRVEEENMPPSHLQHILLMTDGAASDGDDKSIGDMLRSNIGDKSIVVHVLALGDHVDMPLCESIADVTRGVVAHAVDGASLDDAFGTILYTVGSSAKPFTIQIRDKGGVERIQHFGVLNRSNFIALTELSFGPKTVPGCHIGATVGWYNHSSVKTMPTAVMPLYAEAGDPVWNSERAKEPKEITHALEMERILEEHRKKVEAESENRGYEAALELSSQLTTQYEDSGVGPTALARVRGFHRELYRTVTAQSQATALYGGDEPSAASRSMTVSAVASRSSYSQA